MKCCGKEQDAYALTASSVELQSNIEKNMNQIRRAPPPKVLPRTRVDPTSYCLDCWKTWMATTSYAGRQTMRGLTGNTDGHGTDLYEAQLRHDNEIAAATDAMIESLPRLYVWAIYVSCGVSTVWRYPNASLFEVHREALELLEKKLRANSCTRRLF